MGVYLIMLRHVLLVLVALTAQASAFAPGAALPAMRRAAAPAAVSATRMQKVDLLERVETLKLLTALNKAGVLTKIESAGALSAAEKFLPLLDEQKAISLATNVVSIPAGPFYTGAAAVAAGELGALVALPNDTPFLVIKAVTALAAFPLAIGLVIGGQVNGVIQGDKPINLMSVFGPRLRD